MSGDAPAAPSAPASATSSAPAAAPAAAPETSAPRSTSEIAAQVVERTENPPEPAEEESQASPAEVERFSDEEKLLREHGFKKARRTDGQEHMLPRSRVLQIVAKGLARERERLAQIEQETAQLRMFRDGFAQHLAGPEEQFLAYVSQHDPRYRRFLEARQDAAQRPAAGNGHQPPSDEPQPDIDMGNGQATFSPGQLQKWLDWAVEARLEQRLAPINEEREAARRQQQVEDVRQAQRTHVREQITAAQGWTNWGDYEGDVLVKLQEDTAAARRAGQRPRMTLREAYLEVKADRLQAASDPSKVRSRVIADINAAPQSTAIRAGSEVPRQAATRTTADIARAIIERGERER